VAPKLHLNDKVTPGSDLLLMLQYRYVPIYCILIAPYSSEAANSTATCKLQIDGPKCMEVRGLNNYVIDVFGGPAANNVPKICSTTGHCGSVLSFGLKERLSILGKSSRMPHFIVIRTCQLPAKRSSNGMIIGLPINALGVICQLWQINSRQAPGR
jgi:hypothetical protein